MNINYSIFIIRPFNKNQDLLKLSAYFLSRKNPKRKIITETKNKFIKLEYVQKIDNNAIDKI